MKVIISRTMKFGCRSRGQMQKSIFIGNGLDVPVRPYLQIYTEHMPPSELRQKWNYGSDVFILGNSDSDESVAQSNNAVFPYICQYLSFESRMFSPQSLLMRPSSNLPNFVEWLWKNWSCKWDFEIINCYLVFQNIFSFMLKCVF